MNPNQPPNYPPGQYPGHPGDHYPPMYPPGMQQHPSHYMHPQQTTPQFPQSQAPNFMNVQVKQEPTWNQDSRYGMGSSQTQQHVPHYPGSGMAGMGMMGGGQMPMDISMEARNLNMPNPSQYHPGGGATSGAASSSLLAQHLASAPNPHHNYPASSQQSSHLHQLLQQPHQPSYPAGPATQQLQQQQRMVEQHRMEMFQAYNQQQAYHAQQEAAAAYQAQQQARQAGHQTEQNTAAFPPSASSTHSAYSLHQRAQFFQEVPSSHNLPLPTYERQLPEKPADLSQFNTGELCIMGREIVSDLNQKTSQLAQMLKKVMERKQLNQGENPNDLSDNCRRNLDKMAEIREEIENRRPQGWKRLTGDDYIELMLDDSEVPPDEEMSEEQKVKRAELLKRMPTVMSKTPPNEGDVWYQGRWIPAELHKKYMKFEENKEKIKSLAHDLKNLSWKIEVTSPRHLKKVDQTKISKKRGEEA